MLLSRSVRLHEKWYSSFKSGARTDDQAVIVISGYSTEWTSLSAWTAWFWTSQWKHKPPTDSKIEDSLNVSFQGNVWDLIVKKNLFMCPLQQ